MTTTRIAPATRSRWLDWQPADQIFSDSAKGEPTKPPKPGFAGFEGALPGVSQKIGVQGERPDITTSRPTAKGYPVFPPDGCPVCGGQTFRVEAGLGVCDTCAPEGAEIIRDEDVIHVQRAVAVGLLNERGVRIIGSDGPERFCLVVWRDHDSKELREALRLLRLDRFPLRYLEDPSIPDKYRDCRPEPRQRRLFP